MLSDTLNGFFHCLRGFKPHFYLFFSLNANLLLMLALLKSVQDHSYLLNSPARRSCHFHSSAYVTKVLSRQD